MPTNFRINAAWHKENRMPPNPTAEERLNWHLAHAAACNCRELTVAMKSRLEERALAARARTMRTAAGRNKMLRGFRGTR